MQCSLTPWFSSVMYCWNRLRAGKGVSLPLPLLLTCVTLPTHPSIRLSLYLLTASMPHRCIRCLVCANYLVWVLRRTPNKSEENFTNFRLWFLELMVHLKIIWMGGHCPVSMASSAELQRRESFVQIIFKIESSSHRTNRNYYVSVAIHRLIHRILSPGYVFPCESWCLYLKVLHHPTGHHVSASCPGMLLSLTQHQPILTS